jgi:hypothetical protein
VAGPVGARGVWLVAAISTVFSGASVAG